MLVSSAVLIFKHCMSFHLHLCMLLSGVALAKMSPFRSLIGVGMAVEVTAFLGTIELKGAAITYCIVSHAALCCAVLCYAVLCCAVLCGVRVGRVANLRGP